MKKLFLALIAVMLVAGVAMADDKIVEIPFKKVPDLAQRMVKIYFPDNSVVKAEKAKSKDMKNRTRVTLDNEAILEFDKDGHWMIVDCHSSKVPMKMVNGMIQMYLSKNYAGHEVVYMGREIKNGDITIVLDDATELHFTNENKIIE